MRIDHKGITFDPYVNSARMPGYLHPLRELLQPHLREREPWFAAHPRYGINFIHYGFFGEKGANRENLLALIERRRKEPFSEQMFREVWGKTSSRIDQELEDYMRHGEVRSFVHKLEIQELPPVIIREATQSEAARLKARLYMAGSEFQNALDELRIAYWRGTREPAMLAMLASLEQRIGSEERARKILKPLMAMPVPPPRACIVAVRLRLGELLAGKPKDAKLDATESAGLIELLSGALAGGIPDQELCAALAEVVLKSASPPDANTVAFLSVAAKRYPSNKTIVAAYKLGAK
jgi:hypothetical protein